MLAMRSLSQKTKNGPAFRRSILIFTFSIGVGCTQKADHPEADLDPALKSPPVYTQDDLQDLFGGHAVSDRLATATKVQTYRVAELSEPPDVAAEKIFRYTITSEFRELDATTAKGTRSNSR